MAKGTCGAKGCDRFEQLRRGVCHAHYWRLRNFGDLLLDVPLGQVPRTPAKTECSVRTCKNRGKIQRGYCNAHYKKWQKYGDPLGHEPRRQCAWRGCEKQVRSNNKSGHCRYHASRAWKKAHPDSVNGYNRAYSGSNPEKMRVWRQNWLNDHPDSSAEKQHVRRARMQGQFVEKVYKSKVFKRDRGLCGVCLEPVDPANWHLDHVRPISRGGLHCYANVQVSHPRCNLKKATSWEPPAGTVTSERADCLAGSHAEPMG